MIDVQDLTPLPLQAPLPSTPKHEAVHESMAEDELTVVEQEQIPRRCWRMCDTSRSLSATKRVCASSFVILRMLKLSSSPRGEVYCLDCASKMVGACAYCSEHAPCQDVAFMSTNVRLDTESDMESEGDWSRDGPEKDAAEPAKDQSSGSAPVIPMFKFGPHKGKDFGDVVKERTDFYFWARGQAKPSQYLRRFTEWVEDTCKVDYHHKTITLAGTTYINRWRREPEKMGLLAKALQDKRRTVPVCEVCTNFTGMGSNATTEKRTCITCGTVQSQPRVLKPSVDPESCPHINTDSRGSTRSIHKIFCLDCCIFVADIPQDEYQSQKQVVDEALRQGQGELLICDMERSQQRFKRQQARDTAKLFQKMTCRYADKVEGTIQFKDLIGILEDSADKILDVEHDAIAMVHVQLPDEIAAVGGPPVQLEVVDPDADDRVFVVLDEACNRTCHSTRWAEHAQHQFKLRGRDLGELEGLPKSYKGIGGKDGLYPLW